MNSFLSINDLNGQQLHHIFELAVAIKKQPEEFYQALKHKHFAMLFEKPSLRTRASFSVGIEKLGGQVHFYDMQHEKIGSRETVADLAKNLQQWYQGIIARVDQHTTLTELSEHASVPVINALCNGHHPCQALADMLTLYEIEPNFSKWHLAFYGDGNNVARSLVDAAIKLGMRMTLVTPSCSQLDKDFLQTASSLSNEKVTSTNDPAALQSCDVIYTDVWQSMGEKKQHESLHSIYGQYQVTEQLMKNVDAKYFMHCQPVHRGEEATSQVCDSNASLMYQQAANRMAAQQSLLHFIFCGS